MDNRTPDEQLRDIQQATSLRQTAERLDRQDRPVTATLFRNQAWQLETGQTWYDYIKEQ